MCGTEIVQNHWTEVVKETCQSWSCYIYRNFFDGLPSLRHGRRKDFFQEGASMRFSQNFFPGEGQKWWNLLFTPRNWKNNLFLLTISKSRGEPRPPPWPPSDPCTQTMRCVEIFLGEWDWRRVELLPHEFTLITFIIENVRLFRAELLH